MYKDAILFMILRKGPNQIGNQSISPLELASPA